MEIGNRSLDELFAAILALKLTFNYCVVSSTSQFEHNSDNIHEISRSEYSKDTK